MKYQKQVSMGGAWLKGADVQSGSKCKIVSEAVQQPSSFLNKDGSMKTQDVCKVRVQDQNDALNVSLNRATINALVDAYGDDSIGWQGHVLTIETEKVKVAGKTVIAVYLVPDGYERTDDANGYTVIQKKGESVQGDISPEDIPF